MRQLISLLSFLILGIIFTVLGVAIMTCDYGFGLVVLFMGGAMSENLSNFFVKVYDKYKGTGVKTKQISDEDLEIILDALDDKIKAVDGANDVEPVVRLQRLGYLINLKNKLC